MNRRFASLFLMALLGANLFFGARIYIMSAHATPQDDPYANYKLLADVLEKIRQEYVDGDKLTYQDLIHGALRGMINRLDPHSEFMEASKYEELKKDTEGEFGGLGIYVQASKDKMLTVVSPMENTPGSRAGILPHDQILKIDGKNISVTDSSALDEAVRHLRGEPGTPVTLTVHRPSTDETKDYKLVRAIIKIATIKDTNDKTEFSLGDNGIGYVRIVQFGEKTAADLESALNKLTDQGMKALILDLRDNPGGLVDQAAQVCEKFLPNHQLIVTTEGRGMVQRGEYRAHARARRIEVPIVVLVNEGSASAAEIVAGCLQDLQPITHAIILGAQTFGKGSVQTIEPLPGGCALRLTTAKYYTPSHRVIHEHGITPDILVPMSPDDQLDLHFKQTPGALDVLDEPDRERISKLRDVQLDRAMDLLKGVLLYSDRSAATRVASAP